jgi:transcription initiation factor TFIID subunit 9B
MDFAYRYTSTILSDALHIQQEGYNDTEHSTNSKKGTKSNASKNDDGDVSITALRMSIASRVAHQFTGQANLPKEFLKGLADERNRISLLQQAKDEKSGSGINIGGIKLPHERHLMTGTGWGLKHEWESEGEESDDDADDADDADVAPAEEAADARMNDGDEDEGMEDDEGMGTMEDVFGADDDAGTGGDAEMKDS